MRNIICAIAAITMLGSCSTPKYSYNFDYYDYNSGRKQAEKILVTENIPDVKIPLPTETSPLVIEGTSVSADAENKPVIAPKAVPGVNEKKFVEKKYSKLTKSEKKEFRKALKTEFKKYIKARKSGDNGAITKDTKAMDYNLKMAIIFGAVAVTLSFFGGVNSVFWIASVVSLVIAVVFFIKWIAEQ
jgi:hypothetical protein